MLYVSTLVLMGFEMNVVSRTVFARAETAAKQQRYTQYNYIYSKNWSSEKTRHLTDAFTCFTVFSQS